MRLQLIVLALTQAQAELLGEVMRQADSRKVQIIEQEGSLIDRFPDVLPRWMKAVSLAAGKYSVKILRPGEVSFKDLAEDGVVKASVQLTRFQTQRLFQDSVREIS